MLGFRNIEDNKRLKAESSLKSEYLKKVAEKKNNEKNI